jgi:predicted RNA-binding Zn-ribbon protein involved in translation (DUF1610 family)
MKCAACGYEGEFSYIGDVYNVSLNPSKYYELYACPECGTVRIDKEKDDE